MTRTTTTAVTEQRISILEKGQRAGLAWAEGVTKCYVSDELYADVEQYFSEQELIDLTLAISTVATWNRINIAFATTPGTYRVGQFGALVEHT